ncbi:hypothetical protein [Pseudobutyrivibrio sp.]
MDKQDKKCDICGLLFKEGTVVKIVEHTWKKNLFGHWYLGREHKKKYICVKCGNTLAALVRNNLAIKTADILNL